MGIFNRNFNKPGPGVNKDEPRKKGFARFFELLIRDFGDLVKLNMILFICVLPSVVMFLVLTYSNVDGQIAKYNIAKYVDDTLNKLDLDMIYELSDAAIPYFYDFYLTDTKNEIDKQKLERLLKSHRTHNDDDDFRLFNYQRYQANLIREKLK